MVIDVQRAGRQAHELRPSARALLGHVDLLPGGRALDLGCGSRGVIDLLADRVGPGGHVLGLDADPDQVALARDFADARQLHNVAVEVGDARHTGLPDATFDLVHARLVLLDLHDPMGLVAEMARLVRPGGWVAIQEADIIDLCHPAHPAVDRLTELLHAVYAREGTDLHVGRHLAEMLRTAGLVEVGTDAVGNLSPADSLRRMALPDLVRGMWDLIEGAGLARREELAELDAAARSHLAHPDTLSLTYLLFQAWGRKP